MSRSLLCLAGFLFCGLAGWLVAGSSAAETSTFGVTGWRAVLVAGDNAEPVFDNAVAAIDRWLLGQGVPQSAIHRFSAAPHEPGVQPAALSQILGRIASLTPAPGEGCLVFVTSHGKEDEGVWLANGHRYLWPVSLAQALGLGCRTAPTVVIVSSCYSGAFARGSMRAPNRIILTAARADRPSFGCQADRVYTVFDECLLAALPGAGEWRVAFHRELACVRRNERRIDVLPSHPQAFFGSAVQRLSVP
jgi:hypothetical protein